MLQQFPQTLNGEKTCVFLDSCFVVVRVCPKNQVLSELAGLTRNFVGESFSLKEEEHRRRK